MCTHVKILPCIRSNLEKTFTPLYPLLINLQNLQVINNPLPIINKLFQSDIKINIISLKYYYLTEQGS